MTQLQSRDVILREDEFLTLLGEASAECGRWVAAIASDPQVLAMPGVVARLAERAHVLETFLDDHGARENRSFVTFGELVASVRGLAGVKGTGLHLAFRLPRYETSFDKSELESELRRGLAAIDRGLRSLCLGLAEEAERLEIRWTATDVYPSDKLHQRRLLPRNLDADVAVDEREHLALLGSKYHAVLEASRSLGLAPLRPGVELASFVAEHATEDRCRWYESAVHNIQSMYDTYVLRTALEQAHPWLPLVRGHASMALHLLEMATGLVHFYERHENDIRYEGARATIARLVSKDVILDTAVNVCLRQAYFCVEHGAEYAARLLQTFTTQRAVELALPPGITFHARPLALIVQIVRHHGTPVEISMDGESCSAGSLMSLIMLAASHPRPTSIRAKGDSRPLKDLQRLFCAGLGETEQPLPPELGYLRTT